MQRKRIRKTEGFTLIEVLLVLVILVALVGFAGVNLMNAQRTAQLRQAAAQVGMFKTPLDNYRLDVGDYPTSDAGLPALLNAPGNISNSNKWSGPYLESQNIPLDPWGREYKYVYPGSRNPNGYDLWSLGPDGADGTDDDIGNWSK